MMDSTRNTSHYWKNSNENKIFARDWVEKMAVNFPNEIANSIDQSTVYYEGFRPCYPKNEGFIPTISVKRTDVVSNILNYKDSNRKICVLNFASFKTPGGKFLQGSSAQEESLCRESTLYNVLEKHSDIYYARQTNKDWNNLYKNEAIYSPDINFIRQIKTLDFCKCDVLTCAAPNKYAAIRYDKASNADNHKALYSRIKFILDIMQENGVNVPILGAYGCGVFGQDEIEVASIFKDLLESGDYSFDKVDFAIIDEKTYSLFNEVFNPEKSINHDSEF